MRQSDFFNICKTCNIDCCKDVNPPITKKRRQNIESFLPSDSVNFETKNFTYPKHDKDGFCIFYNRRTRKCKIQPVKPETCVAGPFTFDIKDNKILWYLKQPSACPLAAALHQNKELLEKHFQTAKREIRRLIEDLTPFELRQVLTVEEDNVVFIGEDKL